MDNFDTKILKVLQDDSRFNAKQVGDMVGLAEIGRASCRERVSSPV